MISLNESHYGFKPRPSCWSKKIVKLFNLLLHKTREIHIWVCFNVAWRENELFLKMNFFQGGRGRKLVWMEFKLALLTTQPQTYVTLSCTGEFFFFLNASCLSHVSNHTLEIYFSFNMMSKCQTIKKDKISVKDNPRETL